MSRQACRAIAHQTGRAIMTGKRIESLTRSSWRHTKRGNHGVDERFAGQGMLLPWPKLRRRPQGETR